MDRIALPTTIMGYVVRFSGRHQIGLAILSAAVFGISAVPLEIQRRIVNDAVKNGATGTILWLAIAYAGVAVAEQVLKLILNVYRGWVAEDAVRTLRRTVQSLRPEAPPTEHTATDSGVHISMMLGEAEPIGGFVGTSVSEPLLQGGILVSVIGYMIWLEPWTAVLSAAFLVPQMLFVPAMQRAINRRAEQRIETLREVSTGMVGDTTAATESRRIERVFTLNMSIYRIKFSMNLAMNFTYYLCVAAALGGGGLFAVSGRIEIGTVVAVVSGLGKLNDPWGDFVAWARDLSVVTVKYRLFRRAAEQTQAA
jgi:ABC-type multidrug transport system fused ATPase/permease subunit